jgi:hypothetical protein
MGLKVRADGNGASDWAAVAGSRKGLMQQLMLESISSLPYVCLYGSLQALCESNDPSINFYK